MSVLYVAEIGSNHEGNVHLAVEMVRQAKAAGASIAKFQFGWTREAQAAQGKAHLPLRYIDSDFAKTIAHACDRYGIELLASIWSDDGLERAREVNMGRYKIAWAMRNDGAMMAKVLAQHRPVFVSGGQWTELVTPIWCVSKYPTYPEELTMPARFGGPVSGSYYGYSDHCHGIGACLLAVARGANYVEKHFTLNRASQTIRDNAFSATPDEFAHMVQAGREIEMVRDATPV